MGAVPLGGTFRGVAKFYLDLHLKIWKGKNILRLKNVYSWVKIMQREFKGWKKRHVQKNIFFMYMQSSQWGGKLKFHPGQQSANTLARARALAIPFH